MTLVPAAYGKKTGSRMDECVPQTADGERCTLAALLQRLLRDVKSGRSHHSAEIG